MSLWQILLRYKSMNNLNIWDVINHWKSLKAPVNISAPRERQPSLVLHRIRHRHLLFFLTFLHIFSPSLSCSRSSPCSKTQPGPSPADQWLSRGKRTGEGKKALYRCGLKSSEEQRLTQGWWRRMALLKHLGPYQTILGPCRTILGPYHTIWWPYSTTWVCLSTP